MPIGKGGGVITGGEPTKHAEGKGVYKAVALSQAVEKAYLTGTIVSANITTTKKTLIVIIASIMHAEATIKTQIKRVGVDKTQGSELSGADSEGFKQGHLWGWELLSSGSYTYDLVLTEGINIIGASIKAVAVECA